MNPVARPVLDLVRHAERRQLARGLEAAVAAAERPREIGSRVPVATRAVRYARPVLVDLAQRLRDDTPIAPQGLAGVRTLLTDGEGPLYRGGEDVSDLRSAALNALHALDAPATGATSRRAT